jgi:hypothetical protein
VDRTFTITDKTDDGNVLKRYLLLILVFFPSVSQTDQKSELVQTVAMVYVQYAYIKQCHEANIFYVSDSQMRQARSTMKNINDHLISKGAFTEEESDELWERAIKGDPQLGNDVAVMSQMLSLQGSMLGLDPVSDMEGCSGILEMLTLYSMMLGVPMDSQQGVKKDF